MLSSRLNRGYSPVMRYLQCRHICKPPQKLWFLKDSCFGLKMAYGFFQFSSEIGYGFAFCLMWKIWAISFKGTTGSYMYQHFLSLKAWLELSFDVIKCNLLLRMLKRKPRPGLKMKYDLRGLAWKQDWEMIFSKVRAWGLGSMTSPKLHCRKPNNNSWGHLTLPYKWYTLL